jgi:hypothetical protein
MLTPGNGTPGERVPSYVIGAAKTGALRKAKAIVVPATTGLDVGDTGDLPLF